MYCNFQHSTGIMLLNIAAQHVTLSPHSKMLLELIPQSGGLDLVYSKLVFSHNLITVARLTRDTSFLRYIKGIFANIIKLMTIFCV